MARTLQNLHFMPKIAGNYIYSNGLPISWRQMVINDICLSDYVQKYWVCGYEEDAPPLTSDELEILIQYAIYYVHAPLFKVPWTSKEMFNWIARSVNLQTYKELNEWAFKGIHYGIDIF